MEINTTSSFVQGTGQDYKDLVSAICPVPGFEKERIESLSEWVRLRNIIAHEYLDIRWGSTRRFVQETEVLYKNFLEGVKDYLKNRLEADTNEG